MSKYPTFSRLLFPTRSRSGRSNLDHLLDRGGRGVRIPAIELLRLGVGLVWAMNLVFIVDPANLFFSTFTASARSYGSLTLGGPGIAEFVAAQGAVFSWVLALGTAYLAVAFLLGLTTRLACWLGAAGSILLLVTQAGSTFAIPGGTDVGPHPLYLVIYAILLVGASGQSWSVDSWISHPRPRSTDLRVLVASSIERSRGIRNTPISLAGRLEMRPNASRTIPDGPGR